MLLDVILLGFPSFSIYLHVPDFLPVVSHPCTLISLPIKKRSLCSTVKQITHDPMCSATGYGIQNDKHTL